MKQSTLVVALVSALGVSAAQAAPVAWTGTFAMYDPSGNQIDANDGGAGLLAAVTGQIDTVAGTFTLASTDTFFGLLWTTSNGQLNVGPSHSTVDPAPAAASGGTYVGINPGAGQMSGAIDFARGGTTGIDIVMVWDVVGNPALPGATFTSTDWDGDGTPGVGMLDGPYLGFSANFNMTTVPVPAAVWLFGSGLVSLIGVARRKARV